MKISLATNFDDNLIDLVNIIKSKRYTQTRIQRILLYALLGITKKDMSEIASSIEENEMVKDASVRLQGKIIYITIKYNEEINKDQAKQVATSTLEKFSAEELEFYDLGYFLTSEGENGFNITGSKKAQKENISFIRS